MGDNPLIGSRISLISKKNIRYEGTLYSINEADATVALQNVKSYGTEGREKMDGTTTFVPPQDAIHPYLVFRGCDIKDLHVHEKTDEATEEDEEETPAAPAPAATPTKAKTKATTTASKPKPSQGISEAPQDPPTASISATKPAPPESQTPSADPPPPAPPSKEPTTAATPGSSNGNGNGSSRPNKPKQNKGPRKAQHQVGTGASLLNRKERGRVDESGITTPQADFDFESNLNKFDKSDDGADDSVEAYHKDNFFDSISCDILDKERGVNNRLRGSAERNLNTETFGAVALNSNKNRRRGRYGGSGNRGRGRGRGRGGRGRGRGRYNSRNNNNNNSGNGYNDGNNRRTQQAVS